MRERIRKLSFRFFMQEVDWEDYRRHEYLLAYNEIILEFDAHLGATNGE